MRIRIFQVNAFARGPFTGNPAAVCPLDEWLPDETMQGIAAENNLSETAFFVSRNDGAFDLRWFTPTVEVDLCGHATLASGFVVLEKLQQGTAGTAIFHTRSGELKVGRQGSAFALDIPINVPVRNTDAATADAVASIFGLRPVELLDAGLTVAVLDDEDDVRKLAPDFARMQGLGIDWMSVTAPAADDETDFVSRYFAPGSGIDEDPVTGSAHGWLAPYWSQRLHKSVLIARQVSRRGGWLECEVGADRVIVAGEVADYMSGEISIR